MGSVLRHFRGEDALDHDLANAVLQKKLQQRNQKQGDRSVNEQPKRTPKQGPPSFNNHWEQLESQETGKKACYVDSLE